MAPYCLPIQVCISSLASETLPEETQPHTSKCHTTALPRLSRLVFASGPSQGCFLCLDCPSAFLPPGKLLLLFKNLQWLAFPWCILLHGLGQHPYLPLILKLFIAFKVSRYTLLHFFPYSFRKYLQYISWFRTAKALYYVLCKTKGFLLLILRSLQSDGKHRDLHKEQ